MKERKKFRNRQEALFYEKISGSDDVKCTLCPKFCLLKSGEIGECRTRSNRGGVLYSLNYGWLRALNMENIERIPFMEYYNTMNVLSVGSWGCNMHCPYCSSLQLIEGSGIGRALYPNEITQIVSKLQQKDCIGVAYSFGEPAVWYEYVLDTCREVKKLDMKNVISTNGMINREPWLGLLEHIDAVNLDIKSMDDTWYDSWGGSLQTVLETAAAVKEKDLHLEITRVMIPGVNDDKADIMALVRFVSNELGKDVPLHFLEYIPKLSANYIRTPESDLTWAADLAYTYLNNVYIGTP